VQRKNDAPDDKRLLMVGRLATALRLDIGQWFKATAHNYFGRIMRKGILTSLAK
jgi:hypothetical protein